MAQTMRAKIAPTTRASVGLTLHTDARTDPEAVARLSMMRATFHPADFPPLYPQEAHAA